ncbi:MAG: hypothetical protein K1X78_24320 [Verrucomicrobiaceae bacterium]|nr:hypothetical protein [Verrucomicrobiaceae bacterium]
MKSIFRDIAIAEPDTDASAPAVLMSDDYSAPGILDPVPASKPPKTEEDPINVMRKIFMGNQVDEIRTQLTACEKQIGQLRETMTSRLQEIERTLREDIARVSKAAADALQAQNDTLSHDIEQTRTSLTGSMDERCRKLSASAVPRTHLAEILRDLSSRLQPGAS